MADEEKQGVCSDPEYKVGYRHPPREHQFQKGQSGNPDGHEPDKPNYKTRFKKLLEKWAAMKAPDRVTEKMRGEFAITDLPEGATFEEVESLRVHLAAISGEPWAYDRLHDKPQQHTDLTSLGDKLIQRVYNISEQPQKEKLEQLHNDANSI
jgi:hypothetical protein